MPESKQIKRSVFFISDGTAITAETLGHSLLAQFPNVDFDIHIMPYITTEEAAMNVVVDINGCQSRDGCLPLVFDTLVDPHVREIINTAKAFQGSSNKAITTGKRTLKVGPTLGIKVNAPANIA